MAAALLFAGMFAIPMADKIAGMVPGAGYENPVFSADSLAHSTSGIVCGVIRQPGNDLQRRDAGQVLYGDFAGGCSMPQKAWTITKLHTGQKVAIVTATNDNGSVAGAEYALAQK